MTEQPMFKRPITILLVEDNPGHAELVKRGLKNQELENEIIHVSDGEAALNYLNRRKQYEDPVANPMPQLILLDLRLPRVDGLEVLREIKNTPSLNKIPVVILTTSESDQDVNRAYEFQANSYLVKPVDFDKFNSLMKDLGFYWLFWNKQPEN